MNHTKVCIACATLLAATFATGAMAQAIDDANEKPFSLFGDALESVTEIVASEYLQVGYSSSNTSTHGTADNQTTLSTDLVIYL